MTTAVEKTIDDLRTVGALSGVDVANVADVSKATVSRWSNGKGTPQTKTQLVLSDLRYVVDSLAEMYSPDEVRVWLYSRNKLLNGSSAMDLINAGETDQVLSAIESIASHSYL
jgi:DNA-binding LacI/PurR family transcriptional regulator